MRGLLLVLPPLAAVLLVALAFGLDGSRADDVAAEEGLVDGRTQEAIDAGFRYLMRIQNEDGSWSSDAGKKINEAYRPFSDGKRVPHVGITALSILALLAGGHLPDRGPYGDAITRAIDYVIAQVQPNGYVSANHTRMYSHAFATLSLAEVYGVTRTPRVRAALEKALEFTVRSQNETGGWRYVPLTRDSDMSVTVCQVVALRAARNAGLKVPRATIDRALKYVIESANTEPYSRWPVGSFLYQPYTQKFNRDSFALCAAGLTTLFQAGLYDNRSLATFVSQAGIDKDPPPNVQDIVNYMYNRYRRMPDRHKDHYFFWYGNYYAAQAMYNVGGTLWRDWYRMVRDDILARQVRAGGPEGRPEGFWRSNVDDTHAYATASALLILQFPLDQLPIHQR